MRPNLNDCFAVCIIYCEAMYTMLSSLYSLYLWSLENSCWSIVSQLHTRPIAYPAQINTLSLLRRIRLIRSSWNNNYDFLFCLLKMQISYNFVGFMTKYTHVKR